MLNIALDIDGVIIDFVSSFIRTVKERLGFELKYEQIYCHEITQVLGLPKDDVKALLSETLMRNDFQLILGAKEAISRLYEEHHLFIVTGRDSCFEDQTKAILAFHEIPYQALYFSEYLKKHQVATHFDVFVEDSLEEALSLTQRGAEILLYHHPWNSQTLNVKNIIKRVHSWDEILKKVETLTRNRQKILC